MISVATIKPATRELPSGIRFVLVVLVGQPLDQQYTASVLGLDKDAGGLAVQAPVGATTFPNGREKAAIICELCKMRRSLTPVVQSRT